MADASAERAPGLLSPGTVLCTLDELAATGARGFTFRDGATLLMMFLVKHEGGVSAYVNQCPHLGTPLNFLEHRFFSPDGALIQCATHGARFRKTDGLCVSGPCLGAHLKPVAVEISGASVRIAAAQG